MSLIRIDDPSRGVVSNEPSRLEDGEVPVSGLSISSIGPSYHLTFFNCRSLTESKQMGQRAHLLSDVFR
jgi:hypothetical protein